MDATLTIGNLDLICIGVYLALVACISLWCSLRTQDATDLFLAGRRLGWFSIGISLFATNISSTTLVGLMGAAYSWGIAVSNYEWMAAIILVFFAVFIIPRYLALRITTVPEFLGRRFDQRSRLYFSGMTLIANVVVDTAGTLFAGSLIIQLFFPNIDLLTISLAIAVFAGFYTAIGGLAAVVYTDILQTFILLFGSFAIAWFCFAQIDFSWAALVESTDTSKLSLFLPLNDPHLPWLGTLTGVPILGFYFWCTNQFVVQRVLAAKNVDQARYGALFAGFLKLTVLYLMVFPGVIAAHLLPGIDNPDMVFPRMVSEFLPAGLTGIVLAGLIAAVMSSVDSTLNSASTLLIIDFFQPEKRAWSKKQTIWFGRVAIIAFMLLAALLTPFIQGFSGLFHYLQSALAYLVPPVVVVFLGGLFWQRATAQAAFYTLRSGHVLALILFVLQISNIFVLHFTLVAALLFVVSSITLAVLSMYDSETNSSNLVVENINKFGSKSPIVGLTDYRLPATFLILVLLAMLLFHA